MRFDLAAHRAELTPNRPAVQFRGHWYSYAELEQRACQLASRLQESGIKRGDRVGILANNHLAHVDLFLAAPKLGFIYTPFNFRLPAAEQKGLGQYIEPALLLHDDSHAEQAVATGAPLQGLDGYSDWIDEASAYKAPAKPVAAEDPAMILFTGGSTGLPKGALIPYRQLFANCVSTCASWGVSESDCVIQATPAFHAAFNVFTSPLLHAGGRVVLAENFDAGSYLKDAAREKATLMFLVPAMYQMLSEHPDFASADLSCMRWAISGGAPCPEPIQQRFRERGIRFKQGYGMTEAGVNCFSIELDDAETHPGSVGKPILNTQAKIRGDDGTPLERGEVGELTLHGSHLSLGYFRKPDETAKSHRDGWLWTGDLARQDEEGFFYIVGRSKEMFISGGENVYPVEVEAAIYEQAEVAECAVLGVPHERWGETGLAAVALKAGQKLEAETLRQRLKQRLAGYKVPAHFLFLDVLPKSGAGKIHKPGIRSIFESNQT